MNSANVTMPKLPLARWLPEFPVFPVFPVTGQAATYASVAFGFAACSAAFTSHRPGGRPGPVGAVDAGRRMPSATRRLITPSICSAVNFRRKALTRSASVLSVANLTTPQEFTIITGVGTTYNILSAA